MSLRHALLAVLTADRMSGYDLVKYFDGSVAFVWHAPHSQIYPELRRMEADGLVDVEVVPRGSRAEKRVYGITEAGVAELRRWAQESPSHPPERDPYRLRAAFFEWSSYKAAREQLIEHRNHHSRALQAWEAMLTDIEGQRVPLLRRRLDSRPADEHQAIVAFKLFAFQGNARRARAEIEWAEEGLNLLDRLEAEQAVLAGEAEG